MPLLKKALKKPHHLPHYVYWKTKRVIIQSYFKLKLGTKTFKFRGSVYKYYCNIYNITWKNERAVEIPIVWELVKNCHGKILEVGNVLSHYHSINHDVVDKYEKIGAVINQDIVDFSPSEHYDLIVSISTIEHVGWDESPKDDKKISVAIDNLKKLLNPGGIIVISAPIGYNFYLDSLLKKEKTSFTSRFYLKRFSKDNQWVETDWSGVENSKYNNPYPFANGILIGIVET
jgi:hypothetical protein